VDIDLLTKKIRVALLQSGRVQTTTAIGLGGKAEDPMAADAQTMSQLLNGERTPPKLPDFTLSGKLLETRQRQGSDRSVTYTFQMSLTDLKTGNAVWEEEKQIQKTGTTPAVGW
jgi:PBP1b-binding outer membrane lipoprotein LpoB